MYISDALHEQPFSLKPQLWQPCQILPRHHRRAQIYRVGLFIDHPFPSLPQSFITKQSYGCYSQMSDLFFLLPNPPLSFSNYLQKLCLAYCLLSVWTHSGQFHWPCEWPSVLQPHWDPWPWGPSLYFTFQSACVHLEHHQRTRPTSEIPVSRSLWQLPIFLVSFSSSPSFLCLFSSFSIDFISQWKTRSHLQLWYKLLNRPVR